jgi:uncharacterized membrane protein YhaH (DUF805 family)/ribosomal protein L32
MTSNVQMVFRGEVLDGFHPEEVKRRLAQVFKLDEARLAQLFSGARTVLKRSVESDIARRYVDKLAGLGARVHLEPADAPPTTGFSPLPELPEVPVSQAPPPPPWGTPPVPTRPGPLAPQAPSPIPAASAPEAITMVTCPNCGERQSRRVLCRSCATNMEMAAAAKEEEAALARAERLEAMNGRRSHRGASAGHSGAEGAGIFGLSLDGRMGRLKYATANLVTMSLLYVPLIMMLQRPTTGRTLLFALAALAVTAFGMRLAVLRCHDCDKSGWWSMLLWLPTVNIIVTLVLAFAPGSEGANEYGEPPPPAGWPAFGAAVLCAALLFALTFSNMLKALERMNQGAREDDRVVQFQYDPRAASLPQGEAQSAFNDAYLPAATHKAFAVSPSGGWGWAAQRHTPADAARAAMQDCEARRPAYTPPCALVNFNGQWAPGR